MGIITTNIAHCKDCYKCVRRCPLKAIRVIEGHAQVWDELCVHDGACINVCPQGAKKVESHIERVQTLLNDRRPVIASVAPSFAAVWPNQVRTLPGILKQLGFAAVQETAVAAELVAREHKKELIARKQAEGPLPLITSSCPAVVELIEKHFPESVDLVAKVVSPMIFHGHMLKEHYGRDCRVVFLGPCVAKKAEMDINEHRGVIDAVLTFEELEELCADLPLELGKPAGDFALPHPSSARLFPLEGGLIETAGMDTSMLAGSIRAISGMQECIDFLQELRDNRQEHLEIVELMACKNGCIGGPAISQTLHTEKRRQAVIDWYQGAKDESASEILAPARVPTRTYRSDTAARLPEPPDEAIREILAQIGKFSSADELNCGACGYNTCREKAVAVYHKAAEIDMCIPYMRKRAESLANVIMQSIPNGIVVCNRDLNIVTLNPAAEHMFVCSLENIKGKKLGYLIDPKYFRQALSTQELTIVEVAYPNYHLTTKQYILYVEEQDVVIGILVDITQEQKQQAELTTLRQETLVKAQEVIDKQMRVAQEIAGLLGETTAETKVLLTRLSNYIREEGNGHG
ncbi:MAG: [Fe-Fe] hydrogenase large subunit C-terminal domain-containing protein [Limnochordia bacterium]|jgi:iron only hydrogenase large subunit-like protein/uncharacterized Fe-S cluster-containing protein|nr:PAS domain-containing protein [Limnochordia bacterium]MDD2630742.1 [Fe-Fe] hydrogenase large subunit C-terminal domain-containing protein [Limnochordia bacterium]MDD4518764.1 [Fe-Fe] hydrogenase large subunit C-terminal domain-containing protein [Limnochordia bacterium]